MIRLKWDKRNKRKARSYFREISSIILGILIAFWVNSLGVEYKESKTRKQVIVTMLNELKENNANIQSKLDNCDSLQYAFEYLSGKREGSMKTMIAFYSLDFSSASYETAKYSGIFKDLDYALVSKIVDNFDTQKMLLAFDDKLEDRLYGIIDRGIGKGKNYNSFLVLSGAFRENLQIFEEEQKFLIEELETYLHGVS